MRSDVLLDLIHGRLTVSHGRELEDDETYDGRDPARTIAYESRGSYARPIINVTVPIQTLMGMTDTPGVMSGGHALPARPRPPAGPAPGGDLVPDAHRPGPHLCRAVGREPPHDQTDLASRSSPPTRSCIWPGCGRASVTAELDHRTEYPAGETSTENLQPLCEAPQDEALEGLQGRPGTTTAPTMDHTLRKQVPRPQPSSPPATGRWTACWRTKPRTTSGRNCFSSTPDGAGRAARVADGNGGTQGMTHARSSSACPRRICGPRRHRLVPAGRTG